MTISAPNHENKRKIRELRAEHAWLLSRHEPHNAQTAVFDIIKQLEIELSWHEHATGNGEG